MNDCQLSKKCKYNKEMIWEPNINIGYEIFIIFLHFILGFLGGIAISFFLL